MLFIAAGSASSFSSNDKNVKLIEQVSNDNYEVYLVDLSHFSHGKYDIRETKYRHSGFWYKGIGTKAGQSFVQWTTADCKEWKYSSYIDIVGLKSDAPTPFKTPAKGSGMEKMVKIICSL